MNAVERIIYDLQYEIERPTSFGIFHIICLIITILLILYLAKRKETNHEKSLKRVLFTYGFIVLILEILKQVIWSFNYDAVTNIVTWDYQWYSFPFQLCSVPIYLSLICLFLKKGKLRDNLLTFMAFTTILGSISTAIYPEGCFVRTFLIDIHTMYLHLGGLVVSVYLLTSKEVEITFKNLLKAYKVFLSFAAFALLLDIVMYHSGVLQGETFNMFFISPYFTSSLPIFDTIQNNVPYLVFLCLYLLSIFLGSSIIYLIAKLIKNKIKMHK